MARGQNAAKKLTTKKKIRTGLMRFLERKSHFTNNIINSYKRLVGTSIMNSIQVLTNFYKVFYSTVLQQRVSENRYICLQTIKLCMLMAIIPRKVPLGHSIMSRFLWPVCIFSTFLWGRRGKFINFFS